MALEELQAGKGALGHSQGRGPAASDSEDAEGVSWTPGLQVGPGCQSRPAPRIPVWTGPGQPKHSRRPTGQAGEPRSRLHVGERASRTASLAAELLQAPAPRPPGLEGARTDGARPRPRAASPAGAARTCRPPPQRALAPPPVYTDPQRLPRRLGTEGTALLAGAAPAGGGTQPRAGGCK